MMEARSSGAFPTKAEPRALANGSRIALFLLAASLSAQTRPPLKDFSHKRHVALGNVAPVIAAAIDKGTYLGNGQDIRKSLNSTNPCQACHRGLENSEKVTAANMPKMADCLVCHNQIDPPDSCAFCHLAGVKLTPANHEGEFIDTHTSNKSGLDYASCAVCHGRRFKCLGCHSG
jgi:hypothetical protein